MADRQQASAQSDEQRRINELAFELTDQIKAKDGTTRNARGELEKSHTEVEYVAVIYRKGGELHASRLYTSNKTGEAPLNLAIQEAGRPENVVGVVHNHPMAHVEAEHLRLNGHRSKSDILQANRMPSTGDWKVAESQFGERKDVTYFLLDPEGKVRSYSYADHKKWYSEVHESSRELLTNTYNPKPAPVLERPQSMERPTAATQTPSAPIPEGASARTPGTEAPSIPPQSSRESQTLFAQASDRQLPSMQHFSADDQQRMCAHAVYLGAQRGWTGIEGIAPNNATEHHRAGEFLCVAGKSNSPDPSVNGVAVPMSDALKAAPGEWLNKADTARQEYALTQAQAMQQTQDQAQSQNQNQTLTLSRS